MSLNRQEVISYCIFRHKTTEYRGELEREEAREGWQQICKYISKLDRNLSNFSRSYERADVIKSAITSGMKASFSRFPLLFRLPMRSVRKSKLAIKSS